MLVLIHPLLAAVFVVLVALAVFGLGFYLWRVGPGEKENKKRSLGEDAGEFVKRILAKYEWGKRLTWHKQRTREEREVILRDPLTLQPRLWANLHFNGKNLRITIGFCRNVSDTELRYGEEIARYFHVHGLKAFVKKDSAVTEDGYVTARS